MHDLSVTITILELYFVMCYRQNCVFICNDCLVCYGTLKCSRADYQAKSKTMSRGMPAWFTFSMSAARASRMLAFSEEYF